MRVAVVAEWYPSPTDPVHGIWAHRQALATQRAGAEVRVLAMRRPIPPLSVLRAAASGPPSLAPARSWLKDVSSSLRAFELDGINVEPVPFLSPPRPWSYGSWGYWMLPGLALALEALQRRWRFDVLHAHCLLPAGFAAMRWRRLRAGRRPALVVSAHGPDMIAVPARSAGAARATAATLRASDLVLANSSWARERCTSLAGEPIAVRVVHLGAELPSQTARKRGRLTLVTLAHLVARKRHALVLHALARLSGELDLEYLIIGAGPGREPLERLTRELGLTDRVSFLGQLENAAALRELARCHLFVMPGVQEPFGVAFVEAMALGLPAIGTRGEGGPEDIARAGEGMLLVAPGDLEALTAAIRQALADPRGLGELGRRAQETVRAHFTWERCGEATVAAYRRALQPAGTRAGG